MLIPTPADVSGFYQLFLGREPEMTPALDESTSSAKSLIHRFVGSDEFAYRVVGGVMGGSAMNVVFTPSPPAELTAWIADFMPLQKATRAAASRATSWDAVYDLIFNDEIFLHYLADLPLSWSLDALRFALSGEEPDPGGSTGARPGDDRFWSQIPDYASLKDLGARLLGPVCAPPLLWMYERIKALAPEPVLLLGREGFHIQRLMNEIARIKGDAPPLNAPYLDVSRAFLFKLLLVRPEHIAFTLGHGFQGPFREFLVSRYGLSPAEVDMFPAALHDVHVSLPGDKDAIARQITAALPADLCQTIAEKTDVYLAWLRELGVTRTVHCIDIGFSGTIQKSLSILTGLPSSGFYFYRSSGFDDAGMSNCQGEGYWTNAAQFGEGDPLIDWSLVLESIFTAPHGQLMDLKRPDPSLDQGKKPDFVFGPLTRTQQQFHYTHALIDGLIAFIERRPDPQDPANRIDELFDARTVYGLTLTHDRSPEMGFMRRMLEADDRISGYGLLTPFDFLPGLAGNR